MNSPSDPPTVLTIGHSVHSFPEFVSLLQRHGVTAIADVRSTPFSRYQPQFNRAELELALKPMGIRYVFLGDELGGRSRSASDYEDGRVRYDRLAASSRFQEGLSRLLSGARDYLVAVMCSEKEPLECHRTLLVAQELESQGIGVQHIHADGSLESHADAMARLLQLHGMQASSLFDAQEDLIREACRRQERRVAYVDPGMRPVVPMAGG